MAPQVGVIKELGNQVSTGRASPAHLEDRLVLLDELLNNKVSSLHPRESDLIGVG